MTAASRFRRTSRPRKRIAVATAVVGILAFLTPVMSEGVEARWNADSTVQDNEFIATKHTSVGAHRLAIHPEDGERLRPAQSATVEVALLPEGAEPVTLDYKAGDVVTHELTLPAYLTPIDLEGTDWTAATAEDGSWRATHTRRFDKDTAQVHTAEEKLRLTVTVAPRAHDVTIRAEATLPSQFTSKHSLDETSIVAGTTEVELGVYDLQLSGGVLEPGDQANLSFVTHGHDAPETIGLRAGDVISHTIDYPLGLTHLKVPQDEDRGGLIIQWSSDATNELTRTATIVSDALAWQPERIEIPIVQVGISIEAQSALTASIDLPDDLVSVQRYQSIEITGNPVDLRQIVAGDSHRLALAADGRVFGWGKNSSGELGASNYSWSQWSPVKMTEEISFTQLAAGTSYSLGLTEDGVAYSWGSPQRGQLGNGGTQGGYSPKKVDTDQEFIRIAAGSHTSLALTAEGTIFEWGETSNILYPLWSPRQVESDQKFVDIFVGGQAKFGITEDGRLYSWGVGVALGTENIASRDSPEPVAADVRFTSVAAGRHVLAITEDGQLYTWGDNSSAQLGNGQIGGFFPIPQRVFLDAEVATASVGLQHSSVVDRDGNVYLWGSNGFCQLGVPDRNQIVTEPQAFDVEAPAVQIYLSRMQTVFVDRDDTLWGFGDNQSMSLGVPPEVGERYVCTPIRLF